MPLKMKRSDYEWLKMSITAYLTRNNTTFGEVANRYAQANLGDTRRNWDLLWVSVGRIPPEWYNYLKDSHIDSALKRITAELEE